MKKYFYPLVEDPFNSDDIKKGIEVLKSKQLTISTQTHKLENFFSTKFNSKYSLMVNSGSSANLLALQCLINPYRANRLKKGDEIIIPTLCWSTSLWPIIQSNLTPVFVDIDKETLNIDTNTFDLKIEEGKTVSLKPKNLNQDTKRLWGMNRSLLNNAIIGINIGYGKTLELNGVGYRASLKGNQLNLQLGYSHDINFNIPEGIKIAVEKQTTLKITGSDKQLVGVVASKIKTLRKIEPYKGKGIREKGQYVLKKEGKKK